MAPQGAGVRLPIVGDAPAPNPPPHLPTVDALARLWDEVAAKPLWAPPNLVRYVKLRWRMRLELLDPARVKRLGPAGKLNDCRACTEICCVGPHATVLLRLTDIATLIDVGRTELISLDKPRFDEADYRDRPALRRQVESRAWARFPVLARDHMGACQALTAAGQCSLYPSWPLACARFPYALHSDTLEIFYSRRCDSFWIRPDADSPVAEMTVAAVTAYNERVKDAILLEYAPDRLEALGLTRFLNDTPAR